MSTVWLKKNVPNNSSSISSVCLYSPNPQQVIKTMCSRDGSIEQLINQQVSVYLFTPLMVMVLNEKPNLAKWFLDEYNPDIKRRDRNGWNAFTHALSMLIISKSEALRSDLLPALQRKTIDSFDFKIPAYSAMTLLQIDVAFFNQLLTARRDLVVSSMTGLSVASKIDCGEIVLGLNLNGSTVEMYHNPNKLLDGFPNCCIAVQPTTDSKETHVVLSLCDMEKGTILFRNLGTQHPVKMLPFKDSNRKELVAFFKKYSLSKLKQKLDAIFRTSGTRKIRHIRKIDALAYLLQTPAACLFLAIHKIINVADLCDIANDTAFIKKLFNQEFIEPIFSSTILPFLTSMQKFCAVVNIEVETMEEKLANLNLLELSDFMESKMNETNQDIGNSNK